MLTKKSTLITGGAGFIGSHLVDGLLEKGNYIINSKIKKIGIKNEIN